MQPRWGRLATTVLGSQGVASLAVVLAVAAFFAAPAAAALLPVPARDDEVVEVLPAITRVRPAQTPASALAGAAGLAAPASPGAAGATHPVDPRIAASLAREAIGVARQTGDARYWGRAQSALAPWWDKPDAPVDVAVLQATVQQGRHAFQPARAVLQAALARAPDHAQGWLDLAALERVEARYSPSLLACEAVARAGQALYARACQLETRSLQGQHRQATSGFMDMLHALPARGAEAQRSWLGSLLAENEERAGRFAAAHAAYAQSLADEPDLYTAIAYGDLLLRLGDNAGARKLLAAQPQTDAVLLRLALAMRRLKSPGWQALRDELHAREAALGRRGDDLELHDRERALLALWLDDAPARALPLALRNLGIQREPIDWWVALESARAAQDASAEADLRKRLEATGLRDARLAPLPAGTAPPGRQGQSGKTDKTDKTGQPGGMVPVSQSLTGHPAS
ncbi:MAG: hypothetical protein JWQ88_3104 [Rhodoferax sp.]|nr:hypothetical protein [Rhodoferax sp.]